MKNMEKSTAIVAVVGSVAVIGLAYYLFIYKKVSPPSTSNNPTPPDNTNPNFGFGEVTSDATTAVKQLVTQPFTAPVSLGSELVMAEKKNPTLIQEVNPFTAPIAWGSALVQSISKNFKL